MNHIPPEILAQIFTSEPLLSSHVCHRWRAISTGDPRLWNAPVFVIKPITPHARLNLMALWLSRSAEQPLHITLKLDPCAQAPLDDFVIALPTFTLLAEHTPRWETLTLTMPPHGYLFSILRITLASVASLARLRVAHVSLGNWADDGHSDYSTGLLLWHMPELRELRWSNRRAWRVWDTFRGCGVPDISRTHGLVRLALDTFVTPTWALSLISHAPSLSALELTHLVSPPAGVATHAVDAQFTPDAPLCATALQTLTVYQNMPDAALHALFSRLRCPALLHLSLTCGFPPAEYDPAGTALADFLTHSGSNLQALALNGTGIDPAHLAMTLACAPDLRRLAVHAVRCSPAVDDALLAALMLREPETHGGDGGGGMLCPRLCALVLHHAVACTDGALAAMLLSRGGGGGVARKDAAAAVDSVHADRSDIVARIAKVDIVLGKRLRWTNKRDAAYLSRRKARGG